MFYGCLEWDHFPSHFLIVEGFRQGSGKGEVLPAVTGVGVGGGVAWQEAGGRNRGSMGPLPPGMCPGAL